MCVFGARGATECTSIWARQSVLLYGLQNHQFNCTLFPDHTLGKGSSFLPSMHTASEHVTIMAWWQAGVSDQCLMMIPEHCGSLSPSADI